MLNENVGAEIDVIEKTHYGLFPKISNFVNAQYYLMPNDSVMAYIQSWDNNGQRIYYREYYSRYEFYLMGRKIGEQEPPDRAKIEFLQRKYQPLFAEEHLNKLPCDVYCLVIMNDKTIYQGRFQKVENRALRILDDTRLYDIDIRSIQTLKYWDPGKDAKILEWTTIGIFSCFGIAGGQLVNIVFGVPANQAGFYLFSGTILGGLAGYRYAPIIVEKLRPKTVIEFRKSRIKRLDSIGRITYTFKKMKGKVWRNRAKQD